MVAARARCAPKPAVVDRALGSTETIYWLLDRLYCLNFVVYAELDGGLPLNTFGGSLSTGRIHGLWHIIEGALQASGRAGERQVKDVNVSFVGASAPIVEGVVTALDLDRQPLEVLGVDPLSEGRFLSLIHI